MKLSQHITFKRIVLSCILLLFCMQACREKYVPQILNDPATGYLVVDGFINSGTGPTTISLSRSTKLSAVASIVRETKAIVRVIGKVNTVGFLLTETSPGIYTHPQLTLSTSDQYRVFIKTTGGKEYYSDYGEVRTTPDIDSVSWRVENGGIQIYANTHDARSNPGFYQFKYEETWEFNSAYQVFLKMYYDALGIEHHVGYRDSSTFSFDNTIFKCWRTEVPGNIRVYSTEKLTSNTVSLYPLVFIEPGSWKLGIRYSINLKSYSLSRENFRFLEQLRKNTEQLGSVFDSQPSENTGNIHNPANPAEPVIGFIEITEEKQKRIFIDNSQVRFWTYRNVCDEQAIVKNSPDSLRGIIAPPTTVAEFGFGGSSIFRANFSSPACVDCTLRGSNKKPVFW